MAPFLLLEFSWEKRFASAGANSPVSPLKTGLVFLETAGLRKHICKACPQ